MLIRGLLGLAMQSKLEKTRCPLTGRVFRPMSVHRAAVGQAQPIPSVQCPSDPALGVQIEELTRDDLMTVREVWMTSHNSTKRTGRTNYQFVELKDGRSSKHCLVDGPGLEEQHVIEQSTGYTGIIESQGQVQSSCCFTQDRLYSTRLAGRH